MLLIICVIHIKGNDCVYYIYKFQTHYLLYGKGFQTWEYSPQYALRSYLYLLLHAAPAYIYDSFIAVTLVYN